MSNRYELKTATQEDGSPLVLRVSDARELCRWTDKGVEFPDDLTLSEARTLAVAIGLPLPEDESTHSVDGIKFAVSARIRVEGVT